MAEHVLGHAPRDSYEKQASLYPETLRSEYAKASGRLNIFTSIERHLRAAGVDSGGRQEEKAAAEDHRYRRIEAQQQEMQSTFQKMTGAITGILRIMAMSREGKPDAVSEDILRRFMEL